MIQVIEPRKPMNTALLAGAAFFAAVTSVSAQGTFTANTATGTKPRIVIEGLEDMVYGLPEFIAQHIIVEILVNGTAAITPFQLTLAGANAGLFSKGTVTVAGHPGGSAVDITIRAWDKYTGPNFDNALPRASTTLSSFVLGGAVDVNGIPGLPTSIVPAFKGLIVSYLIPEPSTYALAALGLGGLLFLRRK